MIAPPLQSTTSPLFSTIHLPPSRWLPLHLAQKTHPGDHSDPHPFPGYRAVGILGTQRKSGASLKAGNPLPESLAYSSPGGTAGEDRRRGREMSPLGTKTSY